ncbi:MAG: TRM11 family SAM-dependent methyltransferase [Thermoplasmatota archaeon]
MFIIVRDKAYIGWIGEWTQRNSAALRRGSRMPFNRPVMMDPRLARVLVNLSGLPPGSLILDPFLGPGGLAIEAAHLGLEVIGMEMDPVICKGARENVSHQGLSDSIRIIEGDSRELCKDPGSLGIAKIDGIITDPPFGRSAGTMGKDPGDLLVEVLREVADLMDAGAPLVLDSSSPGILENLPGFDLERRFDIRVHRSMTRSIGVLEKIGKGRRIG